MASVAETLSYEEYLALTDRDEGRWEFHDGVIVAMVAPSPEHARIVGQLVRLLGRPGKTPCAALPSGLKVRIESTNRTLIPDVTVVCGAIERSEVDEHAVTNPTTIVEVLSPSTEAYDQGPKLHQYRRIPSLREYVVIAQDRRFASICRRVGDLWAFEDVEAGGTVRLEGLAIELPLDEVYRDGLGVIVR